MYNGILVGNNMIAVKIIKPEQTYKIRREELRKNMTLSEKIKEDTKTSTYHFGVFIEQELAGVVSYMKIDFPDFKTRQYQLRGMAISSNFQGQHLGKALLDQSCLYLKEKGVELIWCKARVKALEFYKKQGFTLYGNEFDIPQIGGHFIMFKKI